MTKIKKLTFLTAFALVSVLLSGCYSWFPVSIKQGDTDEKLSNFTYVNVLANDNHTNPSSIICGYLIKQGYVILPALDPAIKNETLIISYGKLGSDDVSTKITLQVVSGKTNKPIYTVETEGFGKTGSDQVSAALNKALDAIFCPDNK